VTSSEVLIDDGPTAQRGRRCIVRREVRPRAELLRFVVGPDGRVVPDLAGRLPGRGVWLTADRDAIRSAVAKGLFAKAARQRVEAGSDLPDLVEAMLVRRCQDVLGLARRAGQLVAGFDQVAEWLRRGQAAVLVGARDGAPDGRGKLRALALALPIVNSLDRNELGSAIGRGDTVHAALSRGALATRLIEEAERLRGFRRGPAAGLDADVGTEEPI
jgi:predicted RNA-binding protein YlxR (DUF448 family)/ribosomal protein L30E